MLSANSAGAERGRRTLRSCTWPAPSNPDSVGRWRRCVRGSTARNPASLRAFDRFIERFAGTGVGATLARVLRDGGNGVRGIQHDKLHGGAIDGTSRAVVRPAVDRHRDAGRRGLRERMRPSGVVGQVVVRSGSLFGGYFKARCTADRLREAGCSPEHWAALIQGSCSSPVGTTM